MTPRYRARSGFSLAEMMIVTVLMGVAMSGLVVLQRALMQDKGKMIREVTARNEGDLARRMIMRDVAEATWIGSTRAAAEVALGAWRDDLLGFKNLRTDNATFNTVAGAWTTINPDTGLTCATCACLESLADLPNGAGLDQGAVNGVACANDSRYFWYCRTGNAGQGGIWRYEGRISDNGTSLNTMPFTAPATACGDETGAPAGGVLIAGTPAVAKVMRAFGRTGIFANMGGRNHLRLEYDVDCPDGAANCNISLVSVRAGQSALSGNISP